MKHFFILVFIGLVLISACKEGDYEYSTTAATDVYLDKGVAKPGEQVTIHFSGMVWECQELSGEFYFEPRQDTLVPYLEIEERIDIVQFCPTGNFIKNTSRQISFSEEGLYIFGTTNGNIAHLLVRK